MIKVLFIFLFCVVNLYSLDLMDSNLPSNITLNGARSDTLTSTSNGKFQVTTIGYNRNPHLTIQGSGQYQLQLKDSTTTWYSSGFSIESSQAQSLQAAIIGTHTLSIETNGINISNGASFTFISSGNSINAQGTDYGGDSKVRFAKNTHLRLSQNASASFLQSKFFINNGEIMLDNGANLQIESSVIRLQNSLNNSGKITLEGKVQNIGAPASYSKNTQATLQNNGGNITINGDFDNGGVASVDRTGEVAGGFNAQDPGFGGGGNLIINGGSVSINGRLISRLGGDVTADGDILNAQNSSIQIYGGILNVTNGLLNDTGSTLTFGAKDGIMGQLNGNLESKNGNVIINMAGVKNGTYKLINGSATGLTQGQNLNIMNGNNEFSSTTFNPNTFEVTMSAKQGSITQFSNGLDSNNKAVLNALNAKFNNIFSMQDATTLRNITQNVLNSVHSGYVAMPFSILDSIKSNTQDISENIESGFSLQANILGLGLVGGSVGVGGLGGLNISAHHLWNGGFLKNTLKVSATYAYGSLDSKSEYTSVINTSNNVAFLLADRLHFGMDSKIFVVLRGQYLASFMNARRELKGLNDSSGISYGSAARTQFSQLIFDTILGYDFSFNNFKISPFAGLSNVINIFGAFNESAFLESNGLIISAKSQNIYNLNMLIGLQNRYYITQNIPLLLTIGYEMKMLDSKDIEMQISNLETNAGETLHFNIPYKHRIFLNLGAEFSIANNLKGTLNCFYKANLGDFTLDSINAFGLNVAFLYRF